MPADVAAAAAEQHAAAHAQSAGIDAPQPTDLFYKLELEQCFFVGGMGSTAAADVLSREVRPLVDTLGAAKPHGQHASLAGLPQTGAACRSSSEACPTSCGTMQRRC